jgi:hypothetical protein
LVILAIHNLDRVCVSTIESLFNDHSTALYVLEIYSKPEIVATDGSTTTVHKNFLIDFSNYYKAARTGQPKRSSPQRFLAINSELLIYYAKYYKASLTGPLPQVNANTPIKKVSASPQTTYFSISSRTR